MDGTLRIAEAVPEAEIERLRRRLYVPDASDLDVDAYRDAVATRPVPPAPPEARTAFRPNRPVLIAALAVAVLVLGSGAALLGPRTPPGTPGSTEGAAPAQQVRSSSYALTASSGTQRSIDALFTGGREAAATAFGELDDLARHVAVPGATDSTVRNSAAGDGRGTVAVETAPHPLRVARGSVLLLSVMARRPTVAVWRITGWRAGEPHRPHPILLVRPAGEVDRLLVGAIRVPADWTITAVRIETSPSAAVFYRLEVHGASACARFEGQQCPAVGG